VEAETARGTHDLNNVHTLRIYGWSGRHRVVDADGTWVRVETPPRHPGEYWTFAQQRNGILSCHTDLLGTPSLLAISTDGSGQPLVMTIEVPPARRSNLKIEIFPNYQPQ